MRSTHCIARAGWLLAAVVLAIAGPALAQAPAKPPNIVFVLSDDEDLGIHAYMPQVKALIEDRGAMFENFFVPYALCCPSRASILGGQYPHNTLVLGNLPPEGGFLTFRRLKLEESTIATWLQAAGYRTAFYGKYLNGYTEADAPPTGWDEGHAANNDGYFNVNYKLNANGKVETYGDTPEDYLTDVIAKKAAGHIRRFAAEGRPFFLYVAPFSPHSPHNPAPRHADLFEDAELPRPPSFNEADVSDKPASSASCRGCATTRSTRSRRTIGAACSVCSRSTIWSRLWSARWPRPASSTTATSSIPPTMGFTSASTA
jgi:N-acetylglucosamine-6-sulfatase